jgi:hypothetical protein
VRWGSLHYVTLRLKDYENGKKSKTKWRADEMSTHLKKDIANLNDLKDHFPIPF